MQLTVWTYEGPPHVGAMRVATAMEGVHYVLHAPQGDTYADLLFTMIERRDRRPPVTYTTFEARDLGKDTAALFQTTLREAYERFRPEAVLVGASCTAELIQDDPAGLAKAAGLPVPVIPLELPSYQRKENWGAAETFYQIVRTLAAGRDAAADGNPSSSEGATRHPPLPAGISPARGEIGGFDAAANPSPQALTQSPRLQGCSLEDGGTAGARSISPLVGEMPGRAEGGDAGIDSSAEPEKTAADVHGEAAHFAPREVRRPTCNILGPTALGFRHRDDLVEIRKLLGAIGIDVAVVAPLGASPADIARLGEADFNVVLYPEIAGVAAKWLKRSFGQEFTTVVPIGFGATQDFVAEVRRLAGLPEADERQGEKGEGASTEAGSNLPWFSRSVDSTYLTGKRVFVFGDATHALAAARVATEEFGFTLCGLGTYAREFARDIRAAAREYGVEPLISDDYLDVEQAIVAAQPELVLGTQMERHVAKRLGIACAVISAPVHVQDYPARHSPQMGFEGANVLWDTWVHPLVMGLEEHLLGMFRDDFEFNDGAKPSHLGAGARVAAEPETSAAPASAAAPFPAAAADGETIALGWLTDAEAELRKIPFFVRGKARRNTEKFALERGLSEITVETLYDAKAHYSR
ncbi:ferredoxin:protochlorophyllide reductase (ATP-dependent) subunit B [Jiella sonneratiae]|uniref:Light-independent protochlorophyllide reductase subunit B n=1 Tax=Jiella sonneratiae TaxID=2816856 RepID=A0ABS3JA20_9HYPH|nr:ferredoxin:protochlorophyllide reductase (ATP-dependent) subunit B [Jiella sonneratiae]MBO0905396.1 ferredoxin:protochlorophyllide reductase (ATP-dependent) subunit B [Jiella sonneratiae]